MMDDRRAPQPKKRYSILVVFYCCLYVASRLCTFLGLLLAPPLHQLSLFNARVGLSPFLLQLTIVALCTLSASRPCDEDARLRVQMETFFTAAL
jgi:hypothetical protein